MRISSLAERTGVPVATLKFYLREGLLPPGAATSRTQARYDETHVERVRLVRALIESASLSLGAVRQVLTVLDDPPASKHLLMGAAQHALLRDEERRASPADSPADTEPAVALLSRWGWDCDLHDPAVVRLAEQLRAAEAGGVTPPAEQLDAFARACETIADADLATVPEEPEAAVRQVVVGTLLTDPILLTLRRLAQQQSGRAASGDRIPPDGRPGPA